MPVELESAASSTRRLDFILSESAYRELGDLSRQSRRSMTEIVRYGIGLFKLAMEARRNKQRLMVVDGRGNVVAEIVVPHG